VKARTGEQDDIPMTFRLGEHDVGLLRELATSSGLGPECVAALRRRAELAPETREGAPYVLMFGDGNAISRLLAALVGTEAAKDVNQSQATVIVLGRQPQLVRPMATSWKNLQTGGLGIDCLIVLKISSGIAEGTLQALASLGTIELGVLVSRVAQPINADERKLAQSVAGIVESIRVAFVGHSSDELSNADAAELSDYARAQMRAAGFGPERFDGGLFWRGQNVSNGLPGEVRSPAELTAVRGADAGRNRSAALATSLGVLLDSIEARLASAPEPPGLPTTAQDIDRLVGQFEGHLDGLGETLAKLAENLEIVESGQARGFLVDTVQGWTVNQTLPATTLTLAERYRPGIKAKLEAAVRAIAPQLSLDPAPKQPSARKHSAEWHAAFTFLARHRWAQGGVAAAVAAFTVLVAMGLLPLFGIEAWAARLGAFGVAALLGIATYFVASQPWVIGQGPRPQQVVSGESRAPLKGWTVVRARLGAVFGTHFRQDSMATTKESIRELRERLVSGRRGE
jgi:hypothetical protein